MSTPASSWTILSQQERFALVMRSMQFIPPPGPSAALLEAMDDYIMGESLTEKQKELCSQAFKPLGTN